MAADARAGPQDVDPRVLVSDPDDLCHVHAADAADLGEFVCKGNVYGAEGVLHDLGHLGGADVGDRDLALAEGGVEPRDAAPHLRVVRADGAVVVHELVDHVAGNDALRGVHERDVLTSDPLEQRTHEAVDRIRGNRGLDDERRALQHRLACRYDVARVDPLVHLVVRSRHTHDVGIALLVLGRELHPGLHGRLEQLVKPLLLEGGPASVERSHQIFVVVGARDIDPVRGHHESGRQAYVAEPYDINHCGFLSLACT